MNCCDAFCGEKLWVYLEKGGIDLPGGMKYPLAGQGDPVRLAEASSDWDNGTYEELEAFGRHIRNGETPLSNAETARVGTLMGILGGKAMYKRQDRTFTPSIEYWKDLGSAT